MAATVRTVDGVDRVDCVPDDLLAFGLVLFFLLNVI